MKKTTFNLDDLDNALSEGGTASNEGLTENGEFHGDSNIEVCEENCRTKISALYYWWDDLLQEDFNLDMDFSNFTKSKKKKKKKKELDELVAEESDRRSDAKDEGTYLFSSFSLLSCAHLLI